MAADDSIPWRPAASRLVLEARAALLADIRQFFKTRNVLEVETPVLSSAGNTDPNINCMQTEAAEPRFLRTSPEYPMKRLLASGLGDIYELGRVFRAGESGPVHNPEFTLLEWYRGGMSHLQLAEEAIELVQYCGHGRFADWRILKYSYRDLFLCFTGMDPFRADESDWASLAQEKGIRAGILDAHQWQDLMLTHVIQPSFDPRSMTVVYDYPPELAALARIRLGEEPVAERFEIYLGRVELANGYRELSDAAEQLQRFGKEQKLRRIRGEPVPPPDHRLIAALEHGLPDCSGVALGVDRLLMQLAGLDRIEAVLAFPHDLA